MTILILLVLVVLLWVAVLAPSAWRRYSERQGVGSIDSFHHQLQLLEHAGPKTVAPAYRLHTALPGSGDSAGSVPVADTSRPKLVLLRPTGDADAADVEDADGSQYQRVGVLDRPEPICAPDVNADLPAFRREEARQRCTMLLRCLCGVALSTGLIGLFPKFHLAWVFTGLSGIAALALVALMAYAREIEAEQERRRSRRAAYNPQTGWDAASPGAAGPDGWRGWADAPYPGAEADGEGSEFPEEFLELPRAAAR